METAEKLRSEASQAFKNAEDSFQRSDTDGFLSQWASSEIGRLKNAQAEILENGGVWAIPTLMEGERMVTAVRVLNYNKFSYSNKWEWFLEDEEAEKFGRRWIPVGQRSRIQKQLGLHEEKIERPAGVRFLDTGAKGMPAGRLPLEYYPMDIDIS